MRQLTGQDTVYLYLEGDETVAHATALMVLDQQTAKGGLVTFKQILQHMSNCLPELPMLTQKVVQVPLQLDYPFLGHDEDFDIEYHVRHIALPKPGDWRQLCIQAARIHARGLDLSKPLWEMYVIEGVDHAKDFPKGSFAILMKIHHALVDGGAFTVLMSKLLDTTAKGVKHETESRIVDRAPDRTEALMMAIKTATLRQFAFARLIGKLAPRYLMSKLSFAGGDSSPTKPKTFLNQMIGRHRMVQGLEFDLKTFNSVRALVAGATLNDVVLAVCGGALRAYLAHHEDLPEESLVAGVPVNLNVDRKNVSENDIALLGLQIHTEIADPVKRLRAVHKSSVHAKSQSNSVGNRDIGDLSKQVPAPLLSMANSVLYKSGLIGNLGRLFNLVITNVPGPQLPMYFCGAELKGIYGLAPLAHTVGLVISQFSYNGKLFFGIVADRDIVPDPDFLVQCLEDSFESYQAALQDSARRAKAGKKKSKKKTGKEKRRPVARNSKKG